MKKLLLCFCSLFLLSAPHSIADTELMAWGNLTGIRLEGQLIPFSSSLRVIDAHNHWAVSHQEVQQPTYHRDGKAQIVTTALDNISITERVTDISESQAQIHIAASRTDSSVRRGEQVYFCLTLPSDNYPANAVSISSSEIIICGNHQENIHLLLPSKSKPFLRTENNAPTVYIPIDSLSNNTFGVDFQINASAPIDHNPATLSVESKKRGNRFMGFGGNFRLQRSPEDEQVIDYCLKNMRVAFGRAEMPWASWQPEENQDPLKQAREGNLSPAVKKAMLMAQRLKQSGMPLIISCWSPPKWAIEHSQNHEISGISAYKLLNNKKQQIYQSLSDYLLFLREQYHVEADYFSFNESDIGIDVLFSPTEHDLFIKEFGAFMKQRGLRTKMLLGDNSDANTFNFVLPALHDQDARPYIGARSFQSWRACPYHNLLQWAAAAKQISRPLLVAEGSTDAQAYRYPEILNEPSFAFNEINLYIRMCALCQPLSILQWQLTSDYSLLSGGGLNGLSGNLRPTQRFFNLKQLAATPKNVDAISFKCNQPQLQCAVFLNKTNTACAIHIVNNGASRQTFITGLPPSIKQLTMYVTSPQYSMKNCGSISVKQGKARISLPPYSFITLFNYR